MHVHYSRQSALVVERHRAKEVASLPPPQQDLPVVGPVVHAVCIQYPEHGCFVCVLLKLTDVVSSPFFTALQTAELSKGRLLTQVCPVCVYVCTYMRVCINVYDCVRV